MNELLSLFHFTSAPCAGFCLRASGLVQQPFPPSILNAKAGLGKNRLNCATAEGETAESRDANGRRATRLMHLFNEQMQAMSRLKGKTGQQKVRVEHVHVHEGGQAILNDEDKAARVAQKR